MRLRLTHHGNQKIKRTFHSIFSYLLLERPSGWRKTKHDVENLPSGDYVLRFRIAAAPGATTIRL
jgi:hypothetical protein